jgi:hypothetical protein
MSKITNFYNRTLINLNLRPYKTVRLETGLIVDHYKNGRIVANKRDTSGGRFQKTTIHG